MFNEMMYDLSRIKYQEYNEQLAGLQAYPSAPRVSLVQRLLNLLHSVRTAPQAARPAHAHAISGK